MAKPFETITVLSDDESVSILSESLYGFSGETDLGHDMLVDVVQFLTLGGLTFGRAAGTAVSLTKQGDAVATYKQGAEFDLFLPEQVNYGKHLAAVASTIQPTDTVTKGMLYSNKYGKTRIQIQLNSGIQTTSDGRQYFEFLRRDHLVTSNVYTGWRSAETKHGVKRSMKLFVKDLNNGLFYVEKNGVRKHVALGSTEAFDVFQAAIDRSGVIDAYTYALNQIPMSQLDVLADNQQELFLTVYKAIKPSIKPIA